MEFINTSGEVQAACPKFYKIEGFSLTFRKKHHFNIFLLLFSGYKSWERTFMSRNIKSSMQDLKGPIFKKIEPFVFL